MNAKRLLFWCYCSLCLVFGLLIGKFELGFLWGMVGFILLTGIYTGVYYYFFERTEKKVRDSNG